VIEFEKKICPKAARGCMGIECAQFASCMFAEIGALKYMELYDEANTLKMNVCNSIKGDIK
jgi:hypothetical protein